MNNFDLFIYLCLFAFIHPNSSYIRETSRLHFYFTTTTTTTTKIINVCNSRYEISNICWNNTNISNANCSIEFDSFMTHFFDWISSKKQNNKLQYLSIQPLIYLTSELQIFRRDKEKSERRRLKLEIDIYNIWKNPEYKERSDRATFSKYTYTHI